MSVVGTGNCTLCPTCVIISSVIVLNTVDLKGTFGNYTVSQKTHCVSKVVPPSCDDNFVKS